MKSDFHHRDHGDHNDTARRDPCSREWRTCRLLFMVSVWLLGLGQFMYGTSAKPQRPARLLTYCCRAVWQARD